MILFLHYEFSMVITFYRLIFDMISTNFLRIFKALYKTLFFLGGGEGGEQ